MILQKLVLENFQGIRSLEINTQGKSIAVYGDNATGKTTIFNAITWLLFDKASTGVKNFTPQTRGANGEVHHLNHSVTAEFSLDDGKIVKLQKVFKEVWKKKRGAVTESLSGHETDCFIDGVPTTLKEYNTAIESYCGDAEKAKILTMPDYFPEKMKWEDRRQILIDICGDVSDDDIISSTPELAELSKFLAVPGDTSDKYSIEDYRKITMARRKEINSQLDVIPARIDEAEKAKADVSAYKDEDIQGDLEKVEQKIAELRDRKEKILSGDTRLSDIKEQIADLQTARAKAEAEHIRKESEKNKAINQQIAEKEKELAELRFQRSTVSDSIDTNRQTIEKLEKKRSELVEEFNEVAGQSWDKGNETCPTCGQKLPAEMIEAKRSEFNLKKSRKLEEINKAGQECSADVIAKLQADQEHFTSSLNEYNQQIESAEKILAECRNSLVETTPFIDTDEALEFDHKIELLDSRKDEAVATMADTTDIDEELEHLKNARQTLLERQANIGTIQAQDKRIAELNAKQKELTKAFEETEKGLHLTDLFIREKVSRLTERINSKFKTVSFQLFTEQVNGGLKESCEVLIPTEDGRMIPYGFSNNASRINAGLEIIDTLSRAWKIKLPVVVDNAEAVTHMVTADTQTIRLVVSEKDKTLRIVAEKE